jgi:hypothetical protein
MSWKLTFARTAALALVLCLGFMQLSMAQEEMAKAEPEPRDMTTGRKDHSIFIEFCVS